MTARLKMAVIWDTFHDVALLIAGEAPCAVEILRGAYFFCH